MCVPHFSGSALSRFKLLTHRMLSHTDAGSAGVMQQIMVCILAPGAHCCMYANMMR